MKIEDILFRGIDIINGDFVYGFIFYSDERYLMMPIVPLKGVEQPMNCSKWIEIIPNSLAQFSGSYDRNKKRVYNRDIIDIYNIKGIIKYRAVIEYKQGQFIVNQCSVITLEGTSFLTLANMVAPFQVIGNIDKNPELLPI